MILHPGVLALISGSAIALAMVLHAAVVGMVILRRWDFSSSSACQLALERKTYLVSTLVNYALAFQILSFFLFIYTVEDIHNLFVGAMCATGSLNANPLGWYVLLSKITVFFLSGLWIVLNFVDQKVEDYPLVRLKYFLLIGLLPFIGLDLFLQVSYFFGLDPDIITSCCGSLFGEGGTTVTSSISTLPVWSAMLVFYSVAGLFIVVMWCCLNSQQRLLRYLHTAAAAIFFVVAVMAVISFGSIYIYELPMHHCPFDMMQREYNLIGYPLYLGLFGGVFFGLLPGFFQPLKRIPSLQETLVRVERRWVLWSMGCTLFFLLVITSQVVFSDLDYFSY